MNKRKQRRAPYVSGYCLFAAHQPGRPVCKGYATNGALVTPRYTLCSCQCHGSYTERMAAAGIEIAEIEPEEEEDN